MLNVAIVDDENAIADLLREMLARYSAERNIDVTTDHYTNPVLFLTQYTNRFDLVLLDIEMPELNGLDTAKRLRETDDEVPLIFITNMRQYAIKGYEVNASDFIVKPVSYYDLSMKLDRVLKRRRAKNEEVITVKTDAGLKYLPLETIFYVEINTHKLLYHTVDGVFEGRGTLKKIEPLFTANGFSKCNNYCLINLRYVSGIEGYSVFVKEGANAKNKTEIIISRPRKKEFLLALNKYLGVNV